MVQNLKGKKLSKKIVVHASCKKRIPEKTSTVKSKKMIDEMWFDDRDGLD